MIRLHLVVVIIVGKRFRPILMEELDVPHKKVSQEYSHH